MAEILVGVGILLESPRNKTIREWFGLLFVFGGVLISALFTVTLFVFDEGISQGQEKQLAQIRFPRSLNIDAFKTSAASLPKEEFEVLYDPSTADAPNLADEIFVSLLEVGWRRTQKLPAPLGPRTGPQELRDIYPSLPLTQQSGGGPWGLSVVTNLAPNPDSHTPGRELVSILSKTVMGPPAMTTFGRDTSMPDGLIRIIVGPKLP